MTNDELGTMLSARQAVIEYDDAECLIARTPDRLRWRFEKALLGDLGAAEVEACLAGKRMISPLYHIARVIGYYSRIENWNRSKLGELAARRAGQYALES